ncbi:SARP family transcriptional regulator [Jiangella aurantiaca]|uniref:SARP family transcriptional regulator n=1 Tax=Jiangella aurantiaca TaxID=2530373 RepID=A0A4V2YSM5_9ACTN|nr:BTAD domain-containing putative transcriptional regulator [Jiangella aurantiaca]TDD70637.1 SARP family transcriptional regulator [Jiangella aurantiaca]
MHGSAGPQETAALRLMLFDRWRLVAGRQVVYVPARSQRLVALLALRGRQTRWSLAGTLWPDVDEQRALVSLRAAVSVLHRRVMGLVEKDHGEVQLADGVCVDVDEFRTHARQVLSRHHSDLSVTINQPTVVGGELLPGWYDDWVLVERERIQQTRLHVLEALASSLVERGAYADALQVALTAVEIDPLRESARRSVIRVHLAEGNTADAVREYERFRALLRRELDIAPTHHMTGLMRQLTEHASWEQ